MISDARGGHVSPGIYTEEKDVTYSVKSLGITSLGLAGETLYGPAFENIEINEWSDFVDYFGGTSIEKYKGSGLPKYELPYVAKSYLEKSRRLNVVRVLGLSGYHAGPCWVITCDGKPLVILRSRMSYNGSTNFCEAGDLETITSVVTEVTIGKYEPGIFNAYCAEVQNTSSESIGGCFPRFSIHVTDINGDEHKYNVSMNPKDSDYIYRVISSKPDNEETYIYLEAVYESSLPDCTTTSAVKPTINIEKIEDKLDNYLEAYRPAQTPWLVSEAYASIEGDDTNSGDTVSDNSGCNGDCATITMRKLFKFITISDGNVANYQVKVSIQNIDPVNGTFDVVVRDFNDSDENVVILEKFSKCNLTKGSTSYIGYKIGTADGVFVNKSKYVTVLFATDDDLSGSVPCGFLGYPCPDYLSGDNAKPEIAYMTEYIIEKKNRKQYFGFNTNVTDIDILSYKGTEYYDEKFNDVEVEKLTPGFHMDSVFDHSNASKTYVDGVSGYKFGHVSSKKITADKFEPRLINAPQYLSNTIYKDEKVRKFTVCFYGGFDGWDIFRPQRTNTDEFNALKYPVTKEDGSVGSNIFKSITEINYLNLNLPLTAITSDYYAYLAGYNVFANPQDIDINVFATPGIDWLNQKMLTQDAISMIEDPDDGRGGDALYIMNAPNLKINKDEGYGEKVAVDELVNEFNDSEINSSYACTYFPWVLFLDKTNYQYINLPVTKDIVRNIAETDNTSYPWFAPAGMSRGPVDCEKADFKTTLDQEDVLYENRINPIKTFGKDGVKVWGNKTAYEIDSPLNRINVRRLMIRVKKLVTSAAKNLIFEQYTDALEKQFRGLIEPILAEVKTNRGISDYRVITEVTPETRDQHILPAKILIKPTPALEYISISFVVYPESVSFEE